MILVDVGGATIDLGNDGGFSVCSTEECKEFARRILTNMNASADPCVDFYEYACGNWSRNKSDAIWNIRAVANSEIKRRVREMLDEELRGDEIPPVKVAKQWYKTCMDTESMNKRGMQPLLSILDGIGGWPTGRNESGQKWQNIDDYYAHLSGFHSLHDVWVATYGPVPEDESAVLDIPDTPPYSRNILSEFFNTNGNLTFSTMGYWNYSMRIVSEIAESERFRVTEDELEEDMEEIFNFELKLMQISSEDTRKDYVNMTVREFQGWYDSFNPRTENARVDWVDKLIGNFRESGINITEDMMLKVASPIYYEKLVSLLDETPSRIVANYVHWNFVSSMITKTTDEMRELDEKMTKNDSKKQPDRLNLCIKEPRLTAVVAYEYARRYFPDDMMKMTLNVFDDVEEEMKIEIKESNWANKEIKDLALRKVKSIKKNIVYPDWYNNATIMENYFGKLAMGPTYFENSLRFQRYHKLKDLRLLKHKDAVKSFLTYRPILNPLATNAFYFIKSNSVDIPLATLQKPFFSKNQPNTINYALAGFVLAHELHHPFGNLKRLLNESGEEISWPEAMTEQYYKSVQCFIDQYDNYTLNRTPSGPKVENYGIWTFKENMPDTMGMKTAFKAYKRREIINGVPELKLPGLEMFDNDQLFFLSFANLWCETRDSKAIEEELPMHSIGPLRSIGALSNNQDFAETFSCPLSSPMNPKKKCNIWKI